MGAYEGYQVYEVSFVGSKGSRAMAVDCVLKIRRAMGFVERGAAKADEDIQRALNGIYADRAARRAGMAEPRKLAVGGR